MAQGIQRTIMLIIIIIIMIIIIIIIGMRMDQVKFVEDSLYKIWSDHFKFFKGCLPQILI